MIAHNLGYPRIGSNRELKRSCEQYWTGKTTVEDLMEAGRSIRKANWRLQKDAGLDLIPSNDFSFYDHVLDTCFSLGAIPERYLPLLENGESDTDIYFAMARGYQKNGLSITAMEMTKWFDTNYHYIVPEFHKNQEFELKSTKIIDEFNEAKLLGIVTKPVIIGPVSFLMLGKEKDRGFKKLDLLDNLLPIYIEIIRRLEKAGAGWVQLDEPFLIMDLTTGQKDAFVHAYSELAEHSLSIKTLIVTYFDGLRDNLPLATSLPVDALHIDLVRYPHQLADVLDVIPRTMTLSLGIVDGRNVWKNDFRKSLILINEAVARIGQERIMVAPSCSLLHSPCDLDSETDEKSLPHEVKQWLSFAKQKVDEVIALKNLAIGELTADNENILNANQAAIESRRTSAFVHNTNVKARVKAMTAKDAERTSPFAIRREKQHCALSLPTFPTTTIGSFPQTGKIRQWRAKLKKGELTQEQYKKLIMHEIEWTIKWQEEIGLDVLVHGEFERNDMVEYFGEQMAGFVITKNGWVQSYGSRCVKPPVIVGDVSRPKPMTVEWATYAQSLTKRPVKGMLSGPVTILQWSFVRDDQPRSETCFQIALAIRDEVADLEKVGIKIIQVDEPAFREGLPLRRADHKDYLRWAVLAFRLASSAVSDETQIHTHMCYSEFNDIIGSIVDLDVDVITIECSRSQMELLDSFSDFEYPNDIGPGVYDVHSPRVPSKTEMVKLLKKAEKVIPSRQLWVNPDCGLKTRSWNEVKPALVSMVQAAKSMRVSSE
jgi:5-methyltetrahydropteroyltriglutamate--homocysteine methyltransferase